MNYELNVISFISYRIALDIKNCYIQGNVSFIVRWKITNDLFSIWLFSDNRKDATLLSLDQI